MTTVTCVGFLFAFSCQLPAATAPPVVCPPVRIWSRDFQKQVAAELKGRAEQRARQNRHSGDRRPRRRAGMCPTKIEIAELA